MKLLQQLQLNDPKRPVVLKLLNSILCGSVLIYLYLDLSENTSQGVILLIKVSKLDLCRYIIITSAILEKPSKFVYGIHRRKDKKQKPQ